MKRLYAYGLSALLALTGGTVVFYMTAPDTQFTIDDMAELMEGVNERRAAVAAWPLGTNFMRFTVASVMPSVADVQAIMGQVEYLYPFYIRTVSNGTPVYWDKTNLWQAAGIGDGTSLWTVAVATNGPVYGSITNLHYSFQTNVLWECFRALTNLTTTARTPQWLGGSNYHWRLNDPPGAGYGITIVFEGEDPPDPNTVPELVAYNSFDLSEISRTNAEARVGPAGDTFYWRPLSTIYGDGVVENVNFPWMQAYYEHGDALTADSSGGVRIASMASGVVATVQVQWQTTGTLSLVSTGTTNIYTWASNGVTETVFTFTNAVGTNWAGAAYIDAPIRIADYVDYSTFGVAGTFDEWVQQFGGQYYSASLPPPSVVATNAVSLGGAIIRWQFTRCRP